MGYFETEKCENLGLSARNVLDFIEALSRHPDNDEIHSFMFIRHGRLAFKAFYKPYTDKMEHTVFSVSKAFTSTAIGMLYDDGKINLDDRICDYFPERITPEVTEECKKITIRNLLTMTIGQKGKAVHSGETVVDSTMLDDFFFRPMVSEPGTEFSYDGHATYMLSALVSKLTKKNVIEFLMPRLFKPLGISKPFYLKDKLGIFLGYTSMRLRMEDLAKVGLMYLNKGVWENKRILSEEWIEFATACHISTAPSTVGPDWEQGYCASFWRGRHNTFRFCGALGQMCVVMPDYDAVFVVNSGFSNSDIHFILDKFYEHIMLNLKDTELVENRDDTKQLERILKNLSLPYIRSDRQTLENFISGKKFEVQTPMGYDFMTLNFERSYVHIKLDKSGEGSLCFKASFNDECVTYTENTCFAPLCIKDELDMHSFAYWSDSGHLNITARLVPSPTLLKLDIVFEDGKARLDMYTIRGEFDKK